VVAVSLNLTSKLSLISEKLPGNPQRHLLSSHALPVVVKVTNDL
jgi:hypothetical protein